MPSRVQRQLVATLLVALSLRLVAALACQWQWGDHFLFPDSESYWALGQAIARGGPYAFGSDQVFRSPGYPLLLAPIFLLAGPNASLVWGRALSVALGTISVALVWLLARHWGGRRAAFWAGILAAILPDAVAASVLILSEAAFCPVMLGHLLCWTKAARSPSSRHSLAWWLAGGAMAGLTTLIRPSWLLFTPLALLAACFDRRRFTTRLSPAFAASIVGLVVVMLPWWVRNYAATGTFVPTTLQVGASLYDGLNPQADGSSNMLPVAAQRDKLTQAWKTSKTSETPDSQLEVFVDRQLGASARSWAWQHPGRVLALAFAKFCRVWSPWPNEAKLAGWPVRILFVFAFVPTLILGIIGSWRILGRGWLYWLGWMPALYFSAMHSVFVGSIRYRGPALLPWTALAAIGLIWLMRRPTVRAG